MPRLIAIVAMASNRVIGRAGALPWHYPEDLKFFKRTTLGHTIVMGRKTYESIGKPLPQRRNVVLSRSMVAPAGVEVVAELSELTTTPDETLFIIGGAQVFEALLPQCEGLYLTYIAEPHEGDVHLPPFEHLFGEPRIIESKDGLEFRYYSARSASA